MVIVMAASRDKQRDRWIAEIKALEVKLDEIEERVVCFFVTTQVSQKGEWTMCL